MSFGTDFDGCLFHMSQIIQEVALEEFGRPTPAGIIAGYNSGSKIRVLHNNIICNRR